MKTFINIKFKIASITILALGLILSAFLGFFSATTYAHATNEPTVQTISPSSALEYYELSTPVDVYSDDDVTAIIQSQTPSNLLVYKNGVFSSIQANMLTDVALLDANTLIYSTEARIKKINLSEYDHSNPTASISDYPLDQTNSIATTYFALSDEYIITAYDTKLKIFTNEQEPEYVNELTIDYNSRIAINQDNRIFYILDGNIYTRTIDDNFSQINELVVSVNPSALLADQENLYYIESNKIYRISVNGENLTELTVAIDELNQLGNLTTPVGLSFRNGNLLFTDKSANAISEFKINSDDSLEFTGFAIAKGKTAYNRISSSATAISRYGDTLAVVDSERLTIIDKGEDFHPYARSAFKHYYYTDISNGEAPNALAVGKTEILMLFGKDTERSHLRTLSLLDGTVSEPKTVFTSNFIRNITFANGKYYLTADLNDGKGYVYSTDNTLSEFTQVYQAETFLSTITVDLANNIYLSDGTDKVYKLTPSDTGYNLEELATLNAVTELRCDLTGSLFALADGDIYTLNGDAWQAYTLQGDYSSTNVKSLALGFEKSEVIIYYQGEELLCKVNGLDVIAIDSLKLPENFVITDKNAKLNDFKVCATKDDNYAFSIKVKQNDQITFDKVSEQTSETLFICSFTATDGLNRSVDLSLLVNQDQIILARSNELKDVTPEKQTEVPTQAFVTTGVNGYYIPIITMEDAFVLTDGENVRLSVKQIINPVAKISFLNKEYYFASFTVGQETYSGYIPVDFTVEILSQDFVWEDYTVVKVNATKIYSDKELSTKIDALKKNQTVRLFSTEKGVAYVAYKTDAGWVRAYIRSDAITNPANTTVRNILIIIAVMASVCGTTTYFVLRKKS